MSDYYFSMPVGNQRALCISPLTNEELGGNGRGNGGGLGYYLYERDEAGDGVNVLAKITSPDAAAQLFEMLSQIAGEPARQAA
jgi:hypothetical protein